MLRHLREHRASLRLLVTAAAVSACTIVGKGAGALKELVVAHRFGTGDDVDAFLIAVLLPSFAINVVGASLNAALIPKLIEVRTERGDPAARVLFERSLAWTIALLALASLALWLTGSSLLPVLGSSFPAAKLALTRHLFHVLVPGLLLNGASTIFAAVLNAYGRFYLAALTPALAPVGMAVALLGTTAPTVTSMAWGLLAGYVVELVILGTALRSLHMLPRMTARLSRDQDTLDVLRHYAPRVISATLTNGMIFTDQAMAAALGGGAVATLAYASKVPWLVITVSSGLWTTALPHFSQLAARRDWNGLRSSLKSLCILVVTFGVPVTALLFLLSEPIASVVFQRGAFTRQDALVVGRVQALYFLQLPLYVLSMLLQRALSAVQGNWVLMRGAALYCVLNALLDVALMRAIGVGGIALSTTIVTLASVVYMYWALRRLATDRPAANVEQPGTVP